MAISAMHVLVLCWDTPCCWSEAWMHTEGSATVLLRAAAGLEWARGTESAKLAAA